MDFFKNLGAVLSAQWPFMLLAVVLIGLLYFLKAKRKPAEFKKIAFIELVATVVVLIIFALFGFQDLFLLAPIFLIGCELFGYVIIGKLVGVLLVDFILVQGIYMLLVNGLVNDFFNNILFYGLQLATAIALGIIIDNHIRALKKEKQNKVQAAKEQEQLQNIKLDRHVDDLISKYGGDNDKMDGKVSDEEDDIGALLEKYSHLSDSEDEN